MRRPAFQFYPADWRKDPGLRVSSLAARGLWIEIMATAHESEPYGHLTVAGRAMTAVEVARIVGATEREVAALLAELEANGVSSRTEDGVIYSRRMVRDEDVRERRAAGGALSAENPAVPRAKGSEDGPGKGRGGRISSDPSLGGSPSSSSSASPSGTTKPRAARGAAPIAVEDGGEAPEKAARWAEREAVILDLWNGWAERHNHPRAETLSGPRRRALRARIMERGWTDLVPAALAYLEADRWHRENPISIDTFLRPGKVQGYAEKAKVRQVVPAAVPEARDDAEVAFGRILALRTRMQAPGQAAVEFIPIKAVEALGADVATAYGAVGGAERILGAKGDRIGFILQDFRRALRAVRMGGELAPAETGAPG